VDGFRNGLSLHLNNLGNSNAFTLAELRVNENPYNLLHCWWHGCM